MGDSLNVPTCVLKVNIHCCAACPMKVKKKLQKINGVYAIDIDAKNGLVSVQGTVQPSILIQTISEKVGKKAELYAYEKNPNIQNKTLDQGNSRSAGKHEEKNPKSSFTEDSDHDHDKGEEDNHNEVKGSIPEGPEGSKLSWHHPQSAMKKKKYGFGSLFGKKTTFETSMFGNFGGPRPGYARLPPPPAPLPPALSPPPLPPPSYRDGPYQTPPPAVYFYSPPYRTTKPPPPRPYPYDFYERKEPPIGNSVFHSFRDDNVNACSIV
ncbi:hypothetical protein DITRI_Ditri13aG0087400 [Diplodiscus trichospermus]